MARLIDRGADVNKSNFYDNSPLFVAAQVPLDYSRDIVDFLAAMLTITFGGVSFLSFRRCCCVKMKARQRRRCVAAY